MAGSSRVIDLVYRKQFRIMEAKARASSRANMRKLTRLRESNEIRTYNQMLSSAITFFEGREDESINLPSDSPEKLTIEAVMGVLNQFKVEKDATNNVVRENAKLLSDKLRNMFQGRASQTSPMIEYINKLRESMSSLHNSIQPAGEDLEGGDVGGGDESGEGEGEEGEGDEVEAPEEPEAPPPAAGGEAEGEDLAKQLGLS
jgi:hypothetical protein